jgi:NAD(P)H-hydrate repair Nnr-like enzyme with NAD(P)H-hydrate epimerase domain
VVAIDTASELDLTSGKTYGPVMEAAATLTLSIQKTGLF